MLEFLITPVDVSLWKIVLITLVNMIMLLMMVRFMKKIRELNDNTAKLLLETQAELNNFINEVTGNEP